MDDKTFKIKNLEFHLKQVSKNYDICVSKAIKQFLESETDFNTLHKPCETLKKSLDDLMKEYEGINTNNK
jgi:hypothetical protein